MEAKEKRGFIVVLSGFSGAGKGTIMKRIMKTHGTEYALSISATTRKKREGEKEGREYFFKTREEFDKMIENDEFLEYATFNGNSYGTMNSFVDDMVNSGKDIILEIEVQGALQVKEKYPDALLLFVMTPDADELKHRLISRGTEDDEAISSRLIISIEEASLIEQYDYVIINDHVDSACNQVHSIIQAEHCKTVNNTDLIETMKNDLLKFKED